MRLLVGGAALCLAAAAVLMWAALVKSTGLNVPPGVALVGAVLFLLAGARLMQLIWKPRSSGAGLAALIALAFAGMGAWIAFGSGARICVTNQAAGVAVSGASCRVPFGAGAVISLCIAAFAVRSWRKGRKREHGNA